MSEIDITGLNKVDLLRGLWVASKPAIFYSAFPDAAVPRFDEQKAKEAVSRYIDYYDGRCIKCDLRGDSFDPRLFDRDFGEEAALKVVQNLRKK